MRKLVLIVTMTVLALSANEVRAATVLHTTKAAVLGQCNNKTHCFKNCGSTTCKYNCKGKNCTVTIYIVRHGDKGNQSPPATTVR